MTGQETFELLLAKESREDRASPSAPHRQPMEKYRARVGLDGEPAIRRSDDPLSSNPSGLFHEMDLLGFSTDMLDHRIREYKIKRPVCEGKRQPARPYVSPGYIRVLVEIACDDPRRCASGRRFDDEVPWGPSLTHAYE
jgi:hypothetical protein